MLIALRPIDKNNWKDAIQLSVKEEQKSFVASNLYSIAEIQFLDNFFVKAIYLEDQMIGFTMFGIDEDDGNYWIYRLMIDEKFQGKGYGFKAIQCVLEEINNMNELNIPYIMIGYEPDNIGAKKTYEKAGFIETEIAPWGEQLARFTLNAGTRG